MKFLPASRKMRFVLLAALILFGIGIAYSQAQQFYIERSSYDLRIINETGSSIYLKIVGASEGRYFHVLLRANRYVDQEFYPGQRIVCMWDTRGQIIRFGALNINKDGRLRLFGVYEAARVEEGGIRPKSIAPQPVAPDFQIE